MGSEMCIRDRDSTTREKILKKIRQALIHKTNQRFPSIDWDKNIYVSSEDSLEEQFANAFTKIGGQFIFCENELEFLAVSYTHLTLPTSDLV